jgi:hypothetical protein
LEFDIDNRFEVLFGERAEDDHFVETTEKFRLELAIDWANVV